MKLKWEREGALIKMEPPHRIFPFHPCITTLYNHYKIHETKLKLIYLKINRKSNQFIFFIQD